MHTSFFPVLCSNQEVALYPSDLSDSCSRPFFKLPSSSVIQPKTTVRSCASLWNASRILTRNYFNWGYEITNFRFKKKEKDNSLLDLNHKTNLADNLGRISFSRLYDLKWNNEQQPRTTHWLHASACWRRTLIVYRLKRSFCRLAESFWSMIKVNICNGFCGINWADHLDSERDGHPLLLSLFELQLFGVGIYPE